uniref:Uncharacterized protein n=1 Tax=Nelumbo nucifera TaxID=4432 RepID=A0A822XC59_NELNU|nr:TPA_asm: hypothetical protein HUJ06_019383 [Nelumbo nucifera]
MRKQHEESRRRKKENLLTQLRNVNAKIFPRFLIEEGRTELLNSESL